MCKRSCKEGQDSTTVGAVEEPNINSIMATGVGFISGSQNMACTSSEKVTMQLNIEKSKIKRNWCYQGNAPDKKKKKKSQI